MINETLFARESVRSQQDIYICEEYERLIIMGDFNIDIKSLNSD